MKNILKINKLNIISALSLVMILFSSCEKLIEVDVPVNQLTSNEVFLDSVTAQAAVNGMYSVMYNTTNAGTVTASTFGTFVINIPARSADEMYWPSSPDDEFVTNTILPESTNITSLWISPYQTIYQANKIISGMEASSLSSTLKKQLIGEAKFVRAFCYFTLVNFFGDVPLVVSTDVLVTRVQGRTPVAQIYSQMIQDLKDAQSALSANYSWSANLRTRPNTWAATALLARVYLYNKDYALAESESSKVIAQQPMFGLPRLNETFLKASTETIWAFNTNQFGYPFIARALLPTSSAADPNQALTTTLVSAFERSSTTPDLEDDRYAAWVRTSPGGIAYAAKYTSNTAGANTEFAVVLRLAEQYLIRAEARAQQNNLLGSISDIDRIRTRAGLRGTTAQSREQLLLAVEHERQVELFLEYGHRWFDLKRTGRADVVLGALKGDNWHSTDLLYPIPQSQIINNTNLKQNDGY
ncbi:RagB/SusD family nutrient uptake outer membrane protein [Pedobacter sp. MC2016-24]|uniref:RagB/SusD family nutrient uptake outer membrane protein n=1 Tax=Pedobacter sp. MC2016-24 TaxID=2780090 RepID=UPI0018826AC9|nr:RagB/SusD family nutrient uptake outer membrane protein [Pedobacter sp. MC2016-24]MBE9601580.1 RagB/SusD family nutrient uptake outer membrane protein [Pedobacter sp. MC2016-24]